MASRLSKPKSVMAVRECLGCPPNGDGTTVKGEPDRRCKDGGDKNKAPKVSTKVAPKEAPKGRDADSIQSEIDSIDEKIGQIDKEIKQSEIDKWADQLESELGLSGDAAERAAREVAERNKLEEKRRLQNTKDQLLHDLDTENWAKSLEAKIGLDPSKENQNVGKTLIGYVGGEKGVSSPEIPKGLNESLDVLDKTETVFYGGYGDENKMYKSIAEFRSENPKGHFLRSKSIPFSEGQKEEAINYIHSKYPTREVIDKQGKTYKRADYRVDRGIIMKDAESYDGGTTWRSDEYIASMNGGKLSSKYNFGQSSANTMAKDLKDIFK
jgi:hypothetical protein